MAGLGLFDIDSALQDWNRQEKERQDAERQAAPPPQEAPAEPETEEGGASIAEQVADNAIGDASREEAIRRQAGSSSGNSDGTPEQDEAARRQLLEIASAKPDGREGTDAYGLPKSIEAPEYQRRAAAMLHNCLAMKNIQKIVLIGNRENLKKGLSKEPGLAKGPQKGQTSTIAIPTALLRLVQQEVGGLSGRASQNDIMAGFLYWYFGQPDDVMFASPEAAKKASEIVENLDANASPARFSRVNYNMSGNLLEKLDVISERLDAISALLRMSANDGTELKSRADRLYITLCYNLLNMMAFTPPVAPGQKPGDIDMLAGGMVWDLMAGVDDAYEYFRTKNGREIYKAKHRQKPAGFLYNSGSQDVPSYEPSPGQYPDGQDGGSLYTGDDSEGYSDVGEIDLSAYYGETDGDDYVPDPDEDDDGYAADPEAPEYDGSTPEVYKGRGNALEVMRRENRAKAEQQARHDRLMAKLQARGVPVEDSGD